LCCFATPSSRPTKAESSGRARPSSARSSATGPQVATRCSSSWTRSWSWRSVSCCWPLADSCCLEASTARRRHCSASCWDALRASRSRSASESRCLACALRSRTLAAQLPARSPLQGPRRPVQARSTPGGRNAQEAGRAVPPPPAAARRRLKAPGALGPGLHAHRPRRQGKPLTAQAPGSVPGGGARSHPARPEPARAG
jgi:hypothetical protein